MLRDLSVESLMTQSSKKILNIGHSKSNQDLMTNPKLSLSIKAKAKNSMPKKFHQWF
jgi:hypothetical protein